MNGPGDYWSRACPICCPRRRVYTRGCPVLRCRSLGEDCLLTKTKYGVALLLAGVILAMSAPAMADDDDGDPEAGKKVFRQCQACHVADKEQNRVGPHLVGIIGRPAGAVADFGYSDAMANSGIVWDETTIAEYLASPKEYIPGNKMVFAGLRKPEQIQDVIAYLESLDD